MSNQSATYSLWLRPFGDIAFKLQQRIEKLSKTYGTPLFEPHVTLLGRLEQGETELIQLTDTLASALSPFDLVITKAGYLDTFYQALFVHIKKCSELMEARTTAEQLFGTTGEDYGDDYMPHLSLMYGDFDREEKQRILNSMGREFHIRFKVHSLLLIETTGMPSDWRKVHTSEFR